MSNRMELRRNKLWLEFAATLDDMERGDVITAQERRDWGRASSMYFFPDAIEYFEILEGRR